MRRQITPAKILVMGGHWEKKNWEFKDFRWNSVFSLGYLLHSPFLRQKKTKWRMYHPEGIACPNPAIGPLILLFSGRKGSFREEQKSLDARGILGGGALLFGSFHSSPFLNSGVLPLILGYLTHLYLFISWNKSSRTSYTPIWPLQPSIACGDTYINTYIFLRKYVHQIPCLIKRSSHTWFSDQYSHTANNDVKQFLRIFHSFSMLDWCF